MPGLKREVARKYIECFRPFFFEITKSQKQTIRSQEQEELVAEFETDFQQIFEIEDDLLFLFVEIPVDPSGIGSPARIL